MTTEAVSGQARLLLYRNFLFKTNTGKSNASLFCYNQETVTQYIYKKKNVEAEIFQNVKTPLRP